MDGGLLLAYCSLGVMAVVPIYTGALASIRSKNSSKDDIPESISSSDARWFPLIGSAVLFGLYVIFRYVPKEVVNLVVTGYFGLLGIAAFAKVLYVVSQKSFGAWIPPMEPYRVLFTHGKEVLQDLTFDRLNIATFLVSGGFTAYYVYSKNWIASNVLGESFAFGAISLLSLDSFKTGIILLSGLFFYDIFWVFGTEVMVAVAKSFDAPVKMLFPKDLFAETLQFTMLGLGDIVVPGVFVALCLKFDHERAKDKSNYAKPYFRNCFIAYVLGLATTVACMQYFQAAQPALLYLSPACILSVLATALVRGEISALFAFDSTEDDDKDHKKDSRTSNSNGAAAVNGTADSSKKRRPKSSKSAAALEESDTSGDITPTTPTTATVSKRASTKEKKVSSSNNLNLSSDDSGSTTRATPRSTGKSKKK